MKTTPLYLLILPAILIAGLLVSSTSREDTGRNVAVERGVEEWLSEILEEECLLGGSYHICNGFFIAEENGLANKRIADALSFSLNGCSIVRLSHWMVPLRI